MNTQTKIIFYIIVILVSIFTGYICAHAKETSIGNIYRTNGEKIDNISYIQMYPTQFRNKIDALAMASTLENGDVFQDHDTKLYQVFYGNTKIIGVVIISSISEK